MARRGGALYSELLFCPARLHAMDMDESQAYSLAAWHRFDQELTDTLLRAVASSFALIACADGDLAASEIDGLVKTVISSERLPKVEPARLEALFRDLCQAMLTNVEEGRVRALSALKPLAGEPQQAQLVAEAAHFAVHADGRIREPEQAALRLVCEALGVDARTLRESR